MNRHVRGVLQLVAAVGVGAFVGFGVNSAVAEPLPLEVNVRCFSEQDAECKPYCTSLGFSNWSCIDTHCDCY